MHEEEKLQGPIPEVTRADIGNLTPSLQNVAYTRQVTESPQSFMQAKGQEIDPAAFARAVDRMENSEITKEIKPLRANALSKENFIKAIQERNAPAQPEQERSHERHNPLPDR